MWITPEKSDKTLVKICFSDNLFITAKCNEVGWDSHLVYVKSPSWTKIYPWNRIMSLEIFEAE